MKNGHSDFQDRSLLDAFKNQIRVLYKRRKLIAVVFLSIVGIVAVVTFLLPSVYEAQSTIMIEREINTEKTFLLRMNTSPNAQNYDWVKSEVAILYSYPVAAQVIKDLKLHQTDETEISENTEEQEKHFQETVKKFQKNLLVENRRNSNVIEISYEAKKPALTAKVVDQVIEAYTKHRSAIFDQSQTYQFLDKQVEIAGTQLRNLEQKQAAYKNEVEIISPKHHLEILLTKLADYEKRQTEVRTKRIGKEAKLSVITKRMKKGDEVDIPSMEVSDSPSREKYIAKLKGELLDMRIQRDRFLQRFKPEYEAIQELEQNILATKEIIRQEITEIIREEETTVEALRAEEKVLQNAIAGLNREIKEMAQKEYEITQLNRGIDEGQEVYSMLVKQREETRLDLAKMEKGVKVHMISPAIVPAKPVKPRKALNLILAVLTGMFAGIGLAMILENHSRAQAEVSNEDKSSNSESADRMSETYQNR